MHLLLFSQVTTSLLNRRQIEANAPRLATFFISLREVFNRNVCVFDKYIYILGGISLHVCWNESFLI